MYKKAIKKIDISAILEVGTEWHGNRKRDRFFFFFLGNSRDQFWSGDTRGNGRLHLGQR